MHKSPGVQERAGEGPRRRRTVPSREGGGSRVAPVADLVFAPTLACCGGLRAKAAAQNERAHRFGRPACRHLPPGAACRPTRGQDLLLSRTMLSNQRLPYVGRFACGWRRLATTDPPGPATEATWSWRPGRGGRVVAAAAERSTGLSEAPAAATAPAAAGLQLGPASWRFIHMSTSIGPGSTPASAASHSET